MKKTLILVLVLICICTSVFSGRAQAAEIVDSGNCGEKAFWSLDTEGKLLIWGEGKAKGCTYPSPTAWGKYKEDILSVVISDGITEIQDWAFYYCSNLESAEIPVGFTEIPDNAFDGCKLSSIIIPEGVKKIGENAFASCPLYTLQLPSTLEVIEKRAFFGIRAESVTIPENVVGMADGAFDSTWTLKEVHFLGNAPQMDYSKLWFLQDLFTSSTTIYYRPEKKGWQTPKWRGYACYPEKDGEQPTPTPVVDCSHVDDLGYALYGEILKTWREYPYFGTADSCYVVEYDSYICSACGETATWHSDWYDDHVFGANGVCANCGYTADGTHAGTEATPTPKPTSTPTTVVDCSHVDDLGYALYGEILKTWREYPYFGTADSCYVVEYDSYICSACGETATWYSDWYDDHVFGANGVCANCGYTADGVYVGTGGTPTPNPTNAPTPVPTAMPTTIPTPTVAPVCTHIDENGNFLGKEVELWTDYVEINSDSHRVTKYVTYICSVCHEEFNRVVDEWDDNHIIQFGKCSLCGYLPRPCRLDELTDVDYLAFADITYLSFADKNYVPQIGDTIGDMLSGVWTTAWEKRDFSYSELYGHIRDWKLKAIKDHTDKNGFYAMAFGNDHNEVVIAYRGSNPPIYKIIGSWDAWNDWVENDIFAVFGNAANEKSQVPSAIAFYEEILNDVQSVDDIALAGHSLGGALADIVAAYSGSHARSVNAISALDVAYEAWPKEMSKRFEGVDAWNFYDILNELDGMAGAKDIIIKPASIHASTDDNPYFGDLFDGTALDHSISNLLMKDISGKVVLTPRTMPFNNPIVRNWDIGTEDRLNLGTTGNNIFTLTTLLKKWIHYGGQGKDTLIGDINADTLIGGEDNDALDAGWGNDRYVYNKGDGVDIIQDTAGKDTIYLFGFEKNEQIEVISTSEQHIFYEYIYTDDRGIEYNVWGIPGAGDQLTPPVTDVNLDRIPIFGEHIPAQEYSTVRCGGKEILRIANGRSNNRSNRLTIVMNGEEFDITPYLALRTVTKRVEINCPVDVEILDSFGKVVYTIYDSKPGSYYTAYGKFYVTPLENSTHCSKVLDLFEGYSVRIKGIGRGTMDISVYDTDGHTLFDPVGAEDVIITPKTIATLEEDSATGKIVLVVDNDGDGTSDGEVMLLPVHPNEEDHDHPLMKVEAVEPTCVENGNTEYYLCSCGKMFSDSEGMNEIADPNSVILPLTEEHQYKNGVCKVCSQKEANPEDLPQTGDQSQFGVWLALLAVSSIVGINFARKSRNA